ncbi:hypothetical protein niasHS_009922 [Heterodera schachtii]|uniref:Uncharacterized protein n=1 Tax=Heterodera schachtii TaxID=97005 RepID=A0ABD2JCX5_HETSC
MLCPKKASQQAQCLLAIVSSLFSRRLFSLWTTAATAINSINVFLFPPSPFPTESNNQQNTSAVNRRLRSLALRFANLHFSLHTHRLISARPLFGHPPSHPPHSLSTAPIRTVSVRPHRLDNAVEERRTEFPTIKTVATFDPPPPK